MAQISIITPVYNTATYLRQCVESVINQSFNDWQLLLVDDGSTDNSAALCDALAAEDPRIIVIHKANSGVADSRNQAIKIAEGEFIAFLDSDDWLEPDALQIILNAAQNYEADIVQFCFRHVYRDFNRIPPRLNSIVTFENDRILTAGYDAKIIDNYLANKLFKKSMLQHQLPVGRYFEDHATVIKWLANAKKIVTIPNALYNYRMRADSTVNGAHPERQFHYLLAEIDRAEFILPYAIVPTNIVGAKVARAAVVAARNIARMPLHKPNKKDYIEKIIASLHNFLNKPAALTNGDNNINIINHIDIDRKTLGAKQRFRLWLMKRCPQTFITLMLATSHIEPRRRKANLSLFP